MRLILCLFMAMVATAAWTAEVYRTIAPDGTVIYSDRPTGPNSVAILVATSEVSEPARAAARPRPTDADQAVAAAEREPLEPTQAEREEARARNCAVAQERAERYSVSHRLYRTLPNGEREYLDDAEIDEARARAAADVETWCS